MLVLIFVKYFLHLHLYPVFTSPCFLSIPHFLQGLVSLLRVLFSLIHTKHTDKGNSRHQHQHRFQHHTSYLSLFLHNQRLWWFWQICGVLNINITSYLYNRISVVLKNHVDWCQQNSRLSILSWCLQLPPSPPTDLDNIKVLQIQMQNKTNHEEIGGSAGSET